ncbi:hypothetical protein LXA43DRAFT_510467 [Ganoderma leucocontextum]|nr:hypothetical protein LXA43DRAFT_510467 [Ganoderma leucocontextum]
MVIPIFPNTHPQRPSVDPTRGTEPFSLPGYVHCSESEVEVLAGKHSPSDRYDRYDNDLAWRLPSDHFSHIRETYSDDQDRIAAERTKNATLASWRLAPNDGLFKSPSSGASDQQGLRMDGSVSADVPRRLLAIALPQLTRRATRTWTASFRWLPYRSTLTDTSRPRTISRLSMISSAREWRSKGSLNALVNVWHMRASCNRIPWATVHELLFGASFPPCNSSLYTFWYHIILTSFCTVQYNRQALPVQILMKCNEASGQPDSSHIACGKGASENNNICKYSTQHTAKLASGFLSAPRKERRHSPEHKRANRTATRN